MEETSNLAVDNTTGTSELSVSKDQKSLPLDNLSNDSRELNVNPSKGRVVPSKYKSAAVEVARKGKLAVGNFNPLLSRSGEAKSIDKPSVKELNVNPSKGRVVPSKYKSAAVEVPRKGKLAVGNFNPLLSRSGEAKSIDKPSVKSIKGPPLKRAGLDASTFRASRPDNILPNKQCSKIFHREAQNQNSLNKVVSQPNPKLHSTAVDNSLFDKTLCGSADVFSTTVVGKLQRNFLSLGELQDISTISPINTANPSGSSFESITEELPSGSLDGAHVNLIIEPSDYTKEEIEAEYMRYLTWALVDIESEDKYQQQVTEAKKQIAFLTYLVADQQDRSLDNQKTLALLDHYEKIHKEHHTLKELLQNFEGCAETCQNQLDLLTSNLEEQINKVRLKNVHVPTSDKNYEEELKIVLDENSNLLSQINRYLEPERNQNEALAALSKDINVCIDTAKPCMAELEKLASAAIQESSLSFTMDKIIESVKKDGE